jgi:hypothetical protein
VLDGIIGIGILSDDHPIASQLRSSIMLVLAIVGNWKAISDGIDIIPKFHKNPTSHSRVTVAECGLQGHR